jgi:hypothetical protein
VTLPCRIVQGPAATMAGYVGGHAAAEQHAHDGGVALPRRDVQGGVAVGVCASGGRAVPQRGRHIQQNRHDRNVAPLGRGRADPLPPPRARPRRWDAGQSWPRDYDRALIVAEHGSWDRSSKIGYRLVSVKLDASRRKPDGGPPAMTHEVFLEGFYNGTRGDPKAKQVAWGRPADVQQLPDGSLLVSDDTGHTVYRITYSGPAAGGAGPAAGKAKRSRAKPRRGAPRAALVSSSPRPAAKNGR